MMLPALFEYCMSRESIIAGPPLYLCHEMNVEEALKADEAGNADIEVCVPIAERSLKTLRSSATSYPAERTAQIFTRAHMKQLHRFTRGSLPGARRKRP